VIKKSTERVDYLEIEMRKGLSLRAVARELGYSAASLLQHRNEGAFTALSDGSYDLHAVVYGLLGNTSPNQKHRVRLDAFRVKKQTNHVRTPADTEQDGVVLPPQQEAGVQAAMAHLRDEKFRQALDVLHDLPVRMARDMTAIDTEISFPGAVAYFENLVLNDVKWAFGLARKDVLK
jgi:hypothetical protein